MTFKFRLQKILEWKEVEANYIERALEQEKSRLEALKDLLSQEKNLYFEERQELNEKVKSNDFTSVPLLDNSLEMRKGRMIKILESMRTVEGEIRFYAQKLQEAKKNLKVIERLKDQKLKEYEAIENKKEQNTMDELALKTYFKNREKDGSQL
jgi:flagellar FliJ protein